jgi:CheY-like chemotaxis protein
VTLTLGEHDGSYCLDVIDTGAGIPADFVPYVFDRFRQADGSITREHRGLGLGLAIVKELTELHGGAVVAASAGVNRGAHFTVQLPQLQPLGLPPEESASAAPVAGTLAGVRVLAVDDNQDARDVLEASLAPTGARVRIAPSGAAAIREWDREPADLLICDLAMPEMDGFAVLEAIRRRASGRAAPAIAVSAYVSEDYQLRTRAAGFDFHVGKPYDVSELVRLALAALGRPARRSRQE